MKLPKILQPLVKPKYLDQRGVLDHMTLAAFVLVFVVVGIAVVTATHAATKPTPTPAAVASTVGCTGSGIKASPSKAMCIAEARMSHYGWNPSTKVNGNTYNYCLDTLWSDESGWKYNADNHGAYGIPQANPGSKMANKNHNGGTDYLTDATSQIDWGIWYIQHQTIYSKNPCAALTHYRKDGWY